MPRLARVNTLCERRGAPVIFANDPVLDVRIWAALDRIWALYTRARLPRDGIRLDRVPIPALDAARACRVLGVVCKPASAIARTARHRAFQVGYRPRRARQAGAQTAFGIPSGRTLCDDARAVTRGARRTIIASGARHLVAARRERCERAQRAIDCPIFAPHVVRTTLLATPIF